MRYLFVLFVLLVSTQYSHSQNLKRYYRNADVGITGDGADLYYDKDSILYPVNKQGLLGEKRDKSIVEVWEVYKLRSKTEVKLYKRWYCNKRKLTLLSFMIDGRYIHPSTLDQEFYVEPNSSDEVLFKILCD